ncbi:MAG TPA: type VI secretion system membrane subunit TssM [Aromatoleum sp.]|uniref:type VI secretion system membrane subunit TssM n=1 Tax=Aromatoleum sp. TaxID=2307007 RepID=UPI002B487BE5|nr:type VI secretion system membrane subunit TssM [Aromatoleum sp.]HJV27445.1 type VI secretion system membrane subunit TssM [Aromatoleum sp.]
MFSIRSFLTDSRFLSFVGIGAAVAFFFLGAKTLKVALFWAALASGLVVLAWLTVWAFRQWRASKASDAIGRMLDDQGAAASAKHAATEADVATLRTRLQEAIRTIRTSKLGQTAGSAALYELPWYITIGNPAAGKSSAIINSGLKFPFDDGGAHNVRGIGGTRNCDWFFTAGGILLDTAGRYSIYEDDRDEWLGFLDLLRKHRPRAPINGIIVTVSIGELIGNPPAFAIGLAKNLRQRVQELTERLRVFAPVYVMFSKADLIPGFHEFFQDVDWNERDRVWGATFPYEAQPRSDLVAQFDARFDELYEGLRALSVALLSQTSGERCAPGLLTFPSEFASVKPALRAFVATLFEENPFQFQPVFRGFYITSALQSGETRPLSDTRVVRQFGLEGEGPMPVRTASNHGFFLKDLFARVIFADRNLVRQYASRESMRLRLGFIAVSLAALGLALGAWGWSYLNNRELVANVEQDLIKIVRLQEGRQDLQSRMEALEILQDRLEQLERFNDSHPISLGLGLYQGEVVADKLRHELFAGAEGVMLKPVKENLERFLADVNQHAGELKTHEINSAPSARAANRPYTEAVPSNVEDAYNALKTYLMLANREHVEVGHLSDQVTRFWRSWLEANRGTMSREQMIRSGERVLSAYLAHVNATDWPTITNNLAIVDQTRENLRNVVRGIPAAERVYADIKARASTRFPPISVANTVGPENANLVAGSHVVSGAFTAEAWREYVEGAIKDAATSEQNSTDWVLRTAAHDDLTLEGSPEQIQKSLVAMYKADYAEEWKRFVQGVTIAEFETLPDATTAMNRLGDPQHSPIGTLLKLIFDQTSWDNPSIANVGIGRAQTGFIEWFKRSILRMAPSPVQLDLNVSSAKLEVPMGPIGREFAGLGRLMVPRDGSDPLINIYLKQLGQVRTRLNQLKNQGDAGPGAAKLMRATLDGGESEFADALRLVDEQMLAGLSDDQRTVLRPLLVRPIVQTFHALVKPAEQEVNKTWQAQVLEPFNQKLAIKYPFAASAGIEATPTEIGQIFGPEGAIAKFVDASLGTLVVRRGNTVAPRTWGDLGLTLRPEFVAGFARWVGPLEGAASSDGGGTQPQTVFMLLPHPSPGTTEYSVEIDGQKLLYRNGVAQWSNFVWPNPAGVPGARITATTFDGRVIEIVNIPGRFGLEKLISSAQRTRKPDGSFQLTWLNDNTTISVDLRVVSNPQARAGDGNAANERGFAGLHLPEEVVGDPAGAAAPAAVAFAGNGSAAR